MTHTGSLRSSLVRRPSVGAWTLTALAAMPIVLATSGCSQYASDWGYSNRSKVQVQFYAPPGAVVAIRGMTGSDVQGIPENDTGNRLENVAVDHAVFNLSPGSTYRFKYAGAEGLPGASIYGELDVRRTRSAEARRFIHSASIPVVLHSWAEGGAENYHPNQGPSGAGLNQLELEHLRQGDLIRKVYFVADLKRAWETVREIDFQVERLRSAETVLNSELELVDARFSMYRQDALYADPTDDSMARYKDSSGASANFIRLEAERQKLENQRYCIRSQIDDLIQEKHIRTRLLDSMRIVNRRGSVVLATPGSQWPFHDAASQVDFARVYDGFEVGPKDVYETGDIVIPALGEVVLEMRVGGRHMQWGPPFGDEMAGAE